MGREDQIVIAIASPTLMNQRVNIFRRGERYWWGKFMSRTKTKTQLFTFYTGCCPEIEDADRTQFRLLSLEVSNPASGSVVTTNHKLLTCMGAEFLLKPARYRFRCLCTFHGHAL